MRFIEDSMTPKCANWVAHWYALPLKIRPARAARSGSASALLVRAASTRHFAGPRRAHMQPSQLLSEVSGARGTP